MVQWLMYCVRTDHKEERAYTSLVVISLQKEIGSESTVLVAPLNVEGANRCRARAGTSLVHQ